MICLKKSIFRYVRVLICSTGVHINVCKVGGGGQGGGRPGEKGEGGVREAGEEGAGSGIPKVAGSGRKRGKITQYFAIEKMQRGGSQKIQGGHRDYRVREAGGLNPPVPPHCKGFFDLFQGYYVIFV